VFSSLLAQRRFTQDNFAIVELNHPDPLTNTQTAFTIEQPVFDAGLTRLAVHAASLGRDLAEAERDRTSQDLAVAAARAYVRVLQLEADDRATQGAVEAAVSDLERARARRDAGLATDADALAVEVHVADMREREITVEGDLAVARMQLADAVGLPLTDALVLARPGTPDAAAPGTVQTALREALDTRHERRQAALQEEMAANALRTARARFLPTVGAQMAWELNGARVSDQQSSWIVGAHVQINLFRGFADAARITEARHAQARAAAQRERVERAIEIDVRSAVARLAAAHARQDAGRAALAQARESHRITRDRYDNGLATVTDVLRAAEAALDAESRATAAEMDVILGTVALDRALGRL
jgi:outer membrane protein TolC